MWNQEGIRIPKKQLSLLPGRVLVWFSCGAASACAAKLAIEKYKGEIVEILYCNTFAYEHPDNKRFIKDVEQWIGQPIKILNPWEFTGYRDIFDVFNKTGWLVGPGGARCTTELKKRVRMMYQKPDDINILGFTVDEEKRISNFELENKDSYLDWNLKNAGIAKNDCLKMLYRAGVEIPAMYKLGFKNNNCIGCVKGWAGYWNLIRVVFPDSFLRMAAQERKMKVSIMPNCYLDELPPNKGRYESELEIECGVFCGLGSQAG